MAIRNRPMAIRNRPMAIRNRPMAIRNRPRGIRGPRGTQGPKGTRSQGGTRDPRGPGPKGEPGTQGDPVPRGPGSFLGAHFPSKSSKNTMPASKKRVPGTRQRQSASASGARQSGVRTASRNHPSSRAGDQDDVSYKQTPSKENFRSDFVWEDDSADLMGA